MGVGGGEEVQASGAEGQVAGSRGQAMVLQGQANSITPSHPAGPR